jgi:hypothetical protein
MKFNKWTVALAAAGLVSIGHSAQAEEGYISALSKTTLSGFVDTSLSISEKSSDTRLPQRVSYQNEDKMNGFNLDVVQLSLESPLDESDWAAGYKVDLLFGPDAGAYDASGLGIRQAYVNTRVPVGNGLDLKLGVFDAIIGYEGFSNRDNPNYSRNMAYNLQPFNHTGLLGGYQINENISLQAGVAGSSRNFVNDRNDDIENMGLDQDNGNLAYMASVALTAPDSLGPIAGATLYAGFLSGQMGDTASWEEAGVDLATQTYRGTDVSSYLPLVDQENLYIGATLPTPIEGLALGAAYDHISNVRGADGLDADIFALYASYQATDKMSLHGRVEYLDGDHGSLIFSDDKNGAPVDDEMLSLTATVQYDLWENVITRAEVRWDQQEGDGEGMFDGDDDILTFTLNAIYSF